MRDEASERSEDLDEFLRILLRLESLHRNNFDAWIDPSAIRDERVKDLHIADLSPRPVAPGTVVVASHRSSPWIASEEYTLRQIEETITNRPYQAILQRHCSPPALVRMEDPPTEEVELVPLLGFKLRLEHSQWLAEKYRDQPPDPSTLPRRFPSEVELAKQQWERTSADERKERLKSKETFVLAYQRLGFLMYIPKNPTLAREAQLWAELRWLLIRYISITADPVKQELKRWRRERECKMLWDMAGLG